MVLFLIVYLIYFVIIVGSFIIMTYINKTNKFIDNNFSNSYTTTTTYYVLTYIDTKYKKSDINKVSYYENEYNIDKAYKKLKINLNKKLSYKTYSDYSTLFSALKNLEINYILISKSSYTALLELDENIKSREYNIIYKFNLSDTTKVEDNYKDSFNVFLSGVDFAGFRDYNMIGTVNTKTNTVLLTAIPRDYYIPVYGYDGKDTLSFMAPLGIETSIKSIENYFEIELDYFVDIKTEGLVELVDTIEGINYCSDSSYTTTHAKVLNTYDDSTGEKVYVKKGCQEIDGITTLTIARERKAFNGGDRFRQRNIQKIIIAIFDKLKSVDSIYNYDKILSSVSNLYETNMSKSTITNLIKTAINNNYTIDTQYVDGESSYGPVHLTNYNGNIMIPYDDTVKVATKKINEVLEGK